MRKCDKNIPPAFVFRQVLALVLVAGVAAVVTAFFHPALFSSHAAALASDETTWAQVAEWQRQAQAGQDAQNTQNTQTAQNVQAAQTAQNAQAAQTTQNAQTAQNANAAQNAGANAPRILILDARPGEDYRAAHVPGALPLNEPHWEQQLPAVIEALGRLGDTPRVVVYCDDRLCEASRGVAKRLRRELALDEADVFVVKGGWQEWQEWQQTHAAGSDRSDGSVGSVRSDRSVESAKTTPPSVPAPAR